MPKAPRIHKVLSGKHIVWFGESNQWVAFEKPAYKVYKYLSTGKSQKKIQKKICNKYGLNKEESRTFVSEINDEIKKISITNTKENSLNNVLVSDKSSSKQKGNKQDKGVSYSYFINKKHLTIEYSNEKLAYYLHTPIKHFASEKDDPKSQKIGLSVNKNSFSIYRDDIVIESCNTISELKHAFTKELMHSIYNIDAQEWFAWIHGSAITNGREAIIFSSASGSGKSTMAAVLQSRGFRMMSDDTVYLRNVDKSAYPVPAALSIKDGALETITKYLPTPKSDDLESYQFGSRKVRFKAPEHINNETFKPSPVCCIVFINYKPESTCTLKSLSDYEAFCRFHQEAWTSESQESALTFINWFLHLSYYELVYSDTDKAIKEVEKLFSENS